MKVGALAAALEQDHGGAKNQSNFRGGLANICFPPERVHLYSDLEIRNPSMKARNFLKIASLIPLLAPMLAFADLSGDRMNPTNLTLAMGANAVTETTSTSADQEYLHIVVPAMHSLQSIILTSYTGTGKSFIGMQAGSTFTETSAAPNAANMLGYTHFGTTAAAAAQTGGNLLNVMKQGLAGNPAPIGYTTPLAAGDYTIWIQEFGTATYTLTFNVQANANVQAPILAPVGGSFADSVTISMTTATPGASIYYTMDGTTPTTASTLYTGAFKLTNSATIKAFAHDGVLTDSLVTTENYIVTPTPLPPAPTVAVTGSKSIKTTKPSVKIKGTATNATSVTYQVGKGPKKAAAGTSAWSFNAKLKAGSKNVITITVTGINGTATTKVTVTVKKKK